MPWKKGESGNKKGRKVGKPNYFTVSVRDTFLEVFKAAQSDSKTCLRTFLINNPKEFYLISAKLIPHAIKAEVTLPEGLKIIYNADPNCQPIGTDPESDTGLLGEQGSL